MTKNQALEQIYEIIKEVYGDSTLVEIFVNANGIDCEAHDKPFTTKSSCAMRNIKGEWLDKREEI